MSTVHLCDGKDHVLDVEHCGHIFAVVRVTNDTPVKIRDLCRPCLTKHVAAAVDSYKVEPLKDGAS